MQNEESLNNTAVSVIIPAYVENPTQVKAALERLESYKIMAEIYGGTEIIIVDDGSCPEMVDSYQKLEESNVIKVFKLPRAGDWTQPRARNIGMQAAIGDKILLTDLDHLLPPLTFIFLLKHYPAKGEIIKFKRRSLEKQEEISPHPCTLFFLNDKPYAFHEQFCGNYGCDDLFFVEYHEFKETIVDYLVIANDSRYHGLTREVTINKEKLFEFRETNPKPEVTKLGDVYEGYRSISNN